MAAATRPQSFRRRTASASECGLRTTNAQPPGVSAVNSRSRNTRCGTTTAYSGSAAASSNDNFEADSLLPIPVAVRVRTDVRGEAERADARNEVRRVVALVRAECPAPRLSNLLTLASARRLLRAQGCSGSRVIAARQGISAVTVRTRPRAFLRRELQIYLDDPGHGSSILENRRRRRRRLSS